MENFANHCCSKTPIPGLVLDAAAQISLIKIMLEGGDGSLLSPSDIASQLPACCPEMATRGIDCILRILASYSLITCSVVRASDGTDEIRYGGILAPGNGNSIADETTKWFPEDHEYFMYQKNVLEASCDKFRESLLLGGIPFDRAHGMSYFEYMKSNPDYSRMFQDFMTDCTVTCMESVFKGYTGFEGVKTLVNVGGGTGAALEIITSWYPDIHGINFDLLHIVQAAPEHKGIEHIGGDMFIEIPRGDAIFIKWTLHNWSDERCLQVLKNCYAALPDKGKAILVECVLPEIPAANLDSMFASKLDFTMLMLCGSRERTRKEFDGLAEKSGFSDCKLVSYFQGQWIIEFCK